MSKKLTWLDEFAKDFAAKSMNKTASLEKKAEQAVVDADALETTETGATVQFMGESYKIVDASYSDEKGPGVLIEKVAAYEGMEGDPMAVSMGVPAGAVAPGTGAQEYARTDANTTQTTYTNDEDAQFGQSGAAATEAEIAGENAVDRTTVPGHFTKSPGLNSAPAAPIADPNGVQVTETTEVPAEETPAEEAPVTEEVAVEETPVEEAPATEEVAVEEVPAEEVPAEEAPTEEAPVEEDKKLASNRIMARIFNSRK